MANDFEIALKYKPIVEPQDPTKVLGAMASYDTAQAHKQLYAAEADKTTKMLPYQMANMQAQTGLVGQHSRYYAAETAAKQQEIGQIHERYRRLDEFRKTGDMSVLQPEDALKLAQADASVGMFGLQNIGPNAPNAPASARPMPAMPQTPSFPGSVGPPASPAAPAQAPMAPAPVANPVGPAIAPVASAPPSSGSGLAIPPMPASAGPPPSPLPVSPAGPQTGGRPPDLPMPGTAPTEREPIDARHPEAIARLPAQAQSMIKQLDAGTMQLNSIPTKNNQRAQAEMLLGQYNPNHIAGVNPKLIYPQETIKRVAAQYIETGDSKLFTQLGRAGAGGAGDLNRKNLMEEITRQYQAQGLGPRDLAIRQAEIAGLTSGERALGTQTARMGAAATAAQVLAPQVLQTSEGVDRTKYSDINKILLSLKERTGDEKTVRFAIAIQSLANEYAGVMSRGGNVTTDSARDDAYKKLNIAWSKGQIEAGVDQLMIEVGQVMRSPDMVRQHLRETFGANAPTDAKSIPVLKGSDEQQQHDYDLLVPGTKYWLDGQMHTKGFKPKAP